MITATIFFLTLSQSMSKRELLDCFAYTDAREEKACVDAWQARSKEIQLVKQGFHGCVRVDFY